MKNLRLLACTAAIAGLPLLAATPARAMPLAAIELPTFAMAALGGAQGGGAQGCGGAVDPRLGQAIAQGGAGKSAAILGGQVSQLDLIRQQQAGGNPSAIASAATGAAAGTGLTPAAAPVHCQGLALPQGTLGRFQGALRPPLASGPDDFLGSRRLAVSHTVFDGAWNRVSHEGLSRSYASALLGSAAGNANGGPSLALLTAVNAWANTRIRYEDDATLYGRADYWASADATLKRRAGDCEDIAIVKLQLLAALGVPRSDMYLTIARDLTRRADHALLIVHAGGAYYVLDNATNTPLNAAQSYDYQPVISFNGGQKWLHGY